jgi:hypothetical protein
VVLENVGGGYRPSGSHGRPDPEQWSQPRRGETELRSRSGRSLTEHIGSTTQVTGAILHCTQVGGLVELLSQSRVDHRQIADNHHA